MFRALVGRGEAREGRLVLLLFFFVVVFVVALGDRFGVEGLDFPGKDQFGFFVGGLFAVGGAAGAAGEVGSLVRFGLVSE